MPFKMMMRISNGNEFSMAKLLALQQHSVNQAKAKLANSALNAGMISRIHFAKPGCGSCGK